MHPRDREALEQAVMRGSEMLRQSKLDQAVTAFREALSLEPDNPRVLALLGLSHFRANSFADARAIYEQLVDRAPTDASHRLNLGLVHLKLNDADRAIAALEASRALDPSQGRAVSYLGLAYARAGRYGEAYRAFLMAGQNDLATEIESNLTVAERDRIHSQLGRSPQGPVAGELTEPRTPTPRTVPRASTSPGATRSNAVTPATGVPRTSDPEIARTPTPNTIPRTRPPGAPPARARAPSQPGIPIITDVPEPTPPGGTPIASPIAAPTAAAGSPTAHPPGSPPAVHFTGAPTANPPGAPTAVAGELAHNGAPARAAHATGGVPVATEPEADPPTLARTVTPGGSVRLTESMQFVIPRADPIAQLHAAASTDPSAAGRGVDERSMISQAVAIATPSLGARIRTRSGGAPPRPLSELATDELIRPDDGDDPFEIGASGALVIRVAERMMTRLDGVHITGGDLGYELAMRRSRGHSTDQTFDHGGSQLHAVTGRGYLIAAPGGHSFAAVTLDDDILYLREDLVFAFEASLRWENGNVPGLRGKLPVVQFRGDGAVALRLARPLVRVKLPAQGVVFVDADRLAGWIGRVIPRAVVPPPGGPLGAMCVECTGEGVVLVEPAPPGAIALDRRPAAPPPPPPAAASEEPVAAEPAGLGLLDSLDEL